MEAQQTDTRPRVDFYGDPIPPGVKLRLGTIRLRQRQHVNGVAFSPDGKYLASAGREDSIRFWDVNTGQPVRRLKMAEGDGTFAVAFSPDGKRLASVSERGFVRLWDLENGELLSKVLAHVERTFGERVYGVAFAPDGLTFATAGADKSVRLWDAAIGAQLLELATEEGGSDARPVAFSPDGSLLASGTRGGGIQIWNLNLGAEIKAIPKAHERDVTSLAFTRDGKSLISSGTRLERTGERSARALSQIHVWSVPSGEKRPGFTVEDEELESFCTLALSADGRLLASAHYAKIVIWDVDSRLPVRIIRGAETHYGGGRTHGLAISPDNSLVASIGRDNKIYLWNIKTGEAVLPQEESHTNAVIAACFSPDGSQIATGSADATVRLWDAATGQHLRLLDKGSGWVRYVEFFPDGKSLALGRETHGRQQRGFNGEVKIYRLADGEVLHHLPVPDRVMSGALSPSGELLAAGIGLGMVAFGIEEGSPECKILVWNAESGSKVAELSGPTAQIQYLQFKGEGLWSWSEDSSLRKWNLTTGEEVECIDMTAAAGEQRFGRALRLLNESQVIVGMLERLDRESRGGKLLASSIEGGEPLWERQFAGSWPTELAVSPNGRIAAAFLRPLSQSGGNDRLALWSTKDGRELLSFDIEDGSVRSLAFSSDGSLLISGMDAGDALVWDVSAAGKSLEDAD